MNISPQDFKAEVYNRLIDVFNNAKRGMNVDKQKHRLEGFMHAGEFIQLMTHAEGKALLEKAHIEVYGESISQRKHRKEELRRAVEADDEAYFETPAVLRSKNNS